MASRKTILCVDDEQQSLAAMEAILQNAGYKVRTASDGKQALQIFKRGKIDLVISDFQMPNMDGNELISEIKRRSRKTPAILFTGKIIPMPAEMGADIFLDKGQGLYTTETLLKNIRALLYSPIEDEDGDEDTARAETRLRFVTQYVSRRTFPELCKIIEQKSELFDRSRREQIIDAVEKCKKKYQAAGFLNILSFRRREQNARKLAFAILHIVGEDDFKRIFQRRRA